MSVDPDRVVAALPAGGWCASYTTGAGLTVTRDIVGWVVYENGDCYALWCDDRGKVTIIGTDEGWRLVPPADVVRTTTRLC